MLAHKGPVRHGVLWSGHAMASLKGHLACLICAGLLASTSIARGQPSDALDRARATFEDALRDQQAGRSDVALEKFRQVAAVRDTAQVEFRVASCLDALGRKREALAAYELAVRLGRGDAQVQDVVDAANDRMSKLAATMGKVEIDVRGPSADRAEVRVDGELLSREQLKAPLLFDAGPHTLEVQAPEAKPARMTVNVTAGGRAPVSVQLAPAEHVAVPQVTPVTSYTRRDVGIAFLVAGGVSAVGAGVALFFRHDTIATIQADCPNDTCPLSRQSEIEGLRTTALVLGPVAWAAAGLALAGIASGIVLIALGPTKTAPAAWLAPAPGGVALGGRF